MHQLHTLARLLSAVLASTLDVSDEETARRILPIELSSVVKSIEVITRELTKKLSREELTEVIDHLCEQLRRIPDERRSVDRPFTP